MPTQPALQLFARGCKMGWKHFVWAGAVVVAILILAPLSIIPFSHDVAKEVRDWIGAYSGIFLIIAALIAAYPVFLQLDESKIATNKTRVEIIAGIQSALSEENQRVESVGKLVDEIIQLAKGKEHANIASRKGTCLPHITRVRNEIAAKIDKIPRVTEERQNFVRTANEFCKYLESDISTGDPGDFYFKLIINNGSELQKVVDSYKKANDEYRESLTGQIKSYEAQIFADQRASRSWMFFWKR
jgi:hypothetical protein